MKTRNDVIDRVRRALGRTSPPPVPPAIDEPIVRLVHSEIGLPELFAKIARDNGMIVDMVNVEELGPRLIKFLRGQGAKAIAFPHSRLLTQLDVVALLTTEGFHARIWDSISLDELYDFDCGITDVWAAVAEVGAMVVRGSRENGLSLSLIPPIHVAILEPKNFLPDLVDLFEKIPADQNDNFVLITGPGKPPDIGSNHGPGIVQVFILQ